MENAGTAEVNGEYRFTALLSHVGCYERRGDYEGKSVRFTLYRCQVAHGNIQWFISITPENKLPGTVDDIDFYIAPRSFAGASGSSTSHADTLPPTTWSLLNPPTAGKSPAPTVTSRHVTPALTLPDTLAALAAQYHQQLRQQQMQHRQHQQQTEMQRLYQRNDEPYDSDHDSTEGNPDNVESISNSPSE